MVRCADGSFYTGYTRNPEARVRVHNAGKGARYTAGRRPVRLVYFELCASVSEALKREYSVKQLTRDQKQALVRPLTPRERRARSSSRTSLSSAR